MNSKLLVLGSVSLAGASAAWASPDYGPAVWRPCCSGGCTKWYTSGYGHRFVVIHDMEGYYLSSISYLNRCGVSASRSFGPISGSVLINSNTWSMTSRNSFAFFGLPIARQPK